MKESADFQQNQSGQGKNLEHLLKHAEETGQHHGQEDHHRENAEAEDESRVGNRGHDFAAHLVFMFEEPGQVSHHLGKHTRLFSHPDHADVKFAEQTGMFLHGR